MAKRLKWGTIEYLNQLINEYFETETCPTIAGLQHHLRISEKCWRYYLSEKWLTRNKTTEELADIEEDQEKRSADEAFEDYIEISAKCFVIEGEEGNDLRNQIGYAFREALKRIEVFVNKAIFNSKNPAGAIFYAKSALGYREIDSNPANSNVQYPTKITIEILPSPGRQTNIIGEAVKENLE